MTSARAPYGPPWVFARFPLAFVVGFIQVLGTVGIAAAHPGARDLDPLAFALLVAGPVALLALHRSVLGVLGAVGGVTLLYVALGYPYGPIFLSFVVATVVAMAKGHRLAAWSALAACVVVTIGSRLWWLDEGWSWGVTFAVVTWAVVVGAFGELIGLRRAQFAEARRARFERSRREAGEERLRIARELHDVVAHHMSLINVQAGVALHLVDRRPDQVETALVTIKDASKEALTELRALIGVLRADGETAPRAPVATLASLDDLVTRTRQTGVAIDSRVAGDPASVPAAVELAAYRIIQEAVTNIVRHSDARTAHIDVAIGTTAVVVTVDDDGRGVPAGLTADPMAAADEAVGGRTLDGVAGAGVRGMRERAAALGGTVTFSRRPTGGTTVTAVLPLGSST